MAWQACWVFKPGTGHSAGERPVRRFTFPEKTGYETDNLNYFPSICTEECLQCPLIAHSGQ
ncbi:hypothetical protein, partial [Pantoea ananatis]|uniref:hypothetical protein n=1 Tax=Pantoea ananas TaxID=553 RepID=UPI001B30C329